MAARDNEVGAALRQAIGDAGYQQGALAKELRKQPAKISKLVQGHEPLSLELAKQIDLILKSDLESLIRARHAPVDLYVSSPITALNPDGVVTAHHQVGRIVAVLRRQIRHVHWPGEVITGLDQLKDADLATEENIPALARAKAFLYLQFQETHRPSSSYIELGYALGRGIKTTIVIAKSLSIPFMLSEHFEGVAKGTAELPDARVRLVASAESATTLLGRDGRMLLGLPEEVKLDTGPPPLY